MEQVMVGAQTSVCSVCGRSFAPRFSFQQQEQGGQRVAFCSARCQLKSLTVGEPRTCAACGERFVPEYAFQSANLDGRAVHFCSMACRDAGPATERRLGKLAIYNLKGGTGKTTTAVNLASALADMGRRVLLVDADPQGSVGVCLGVPARRGLYQVLVLGADPASCIVEARPGLDVLPSSRSLAGAEIYLGSRPERHRVMHDRLAAVEGYDITIVDCSPSVGLIAQNALRFADGVIVPVSCEHLGVVGLEQAVQTLADLEEQTGHQTRIEGVLPTFLDRRLNVCSEAMRTLRAEHGERLLRPIRISSKLKEAPASAATIHEHAPRSRGSRDYLRLARWLSDRHLGELPSA